MALRIVPVVVIGLGLMLAAAVLAVYLVNPEPDYAYLDPEPDAVVWEEGDETTLWLFTNRRRVDMRIDRVSLGLGDIRRIFPESGRAVTLGRGEGCIDWAVDGLEIYSITGSAGNRSVWVQGTIDRGATTGAVDVQIRAYFEADGLSNPLEREETVSSGNSGFSSVEFITDDSGPWVVEASHDDRFPEPYTRRATADLSEDPGVALAAAVDDQDAEHVRLVQHGGVGVIACAEDNDVGIGLHGDDGALLNHYLVDVHADPTPVPTATPVSAPAAATYSDVRVCVDSADARANYLDGWEYVGAALDATDFGRTGDILAVSIADTVDTNEYVYFFATELTGGDVQIRVTPAGAGNTLGLDADRVYPIEATATTSAGTDTITLGVWLDITTLSPDDDGLCS